MVREESASHDKRNALKMTKKMKKTKKTKETKETP